MRTLLQLTFGLLFLTTAACTDGQPEVIVDAGAPLVVDAAPPRWTSLLGGEYALAPGTEAEVCIAKTLDHDVAVTGFRAPDDPSIHHLTLTWDEPSAPDHGPQPCGGNDDRSWAFGTGAGTDALELPPGYGMVFRKGQQLSLTAHVFNTTDQEVVSRPGVEGLVVSEPAEHTADVYFVGPVGFVDAPESLVSDCIVEEDQVLLGIVPHMHFRGTHLRLELIHDGESSVLYDEDFDFEHQRARPLPTVSIARGDTLRTTCNWRGEGRPITFGNSSNDEMCYAILTRSPALGGKRFCGH